jgi:uncharacterized protein (DUF433 family)
MPNEFLTPEEARALIERAERHHAEMCARSPELARFFPPITDQQFRHLIELALLGELRRVDSLPPLDDPDWSRCPDVESVPGRCSGAWVVKGTRVLVQGILDNAADGCTAEEIATEIYDLPLDVVRRILRFADDDADDD